MYMYVKGLCEDECEVPEADYNADRSKESLTMWAARVERINYGIGNCLIGQKEYELAMEVFDDIYRKTGCVDLAAGLGRIALLLGDTSTAKQYFAEMKQDKDGKATTADGHLNAGFIAVSDGEYSKAAESFKQAW